MTSVAAINLDRSVITKICECEVSEVSLRDQQPGVERCIYILLHSVFDFRSECSGQDWTRNLESWGFKLQLWFFPGGKTGI